MRISACVITKNEEENIKTCLESVKEVANEIIVVDTGSEDKTVEISKSFGAKVYQYEWDNNFANARNYALSKANGDWIIFLDADEYFTAKSIKVLKDVIRKAIEGKFEFIFVLLMNYDKIKKSYVNSVPVIRIFRNHPDIRYIGAIHERITHMNAKDNRMDAVDSVKILHTGYPSDKKLLNKKASRNLELLLNEIKKQPNDSNLCYYISESYAMGGDFHKALEYALKAIEYDNGTLFDMYKKNYMNIIDYLTALKTQDRDIIDVIKEAISKYPDFPDFYFKLGHFLLKWERVRDSITQSETGLDLLKGAMNTHSRGQFYIKEIMHTLARLNYNIKNIDRSVRYYVETLKTEKYYFEALTELVMIFSKFENADTILNFMLKIYDKDNLKDILFLLKAALRVPNAELAEACFAKLDPNLAGKLKKENCYIKLIKNDYAESAREYLALYKKSYGSSMAMRGIIASFLFSENTILKEFKYIVKPSLKRIAEKLLGEEIILQESDKGDVLEFFKECCILDEYKLIDNILEASPEVKLLLETAEIYFVYKKYNVAVEMFGRYIESENMIPSLKLSDILYTMGYCMYQTGENHMTVQFLQDARKLNPSDYRIYELALNSYDNPEDSEIIADMLEEAHIRFPDSEFIKSQMEKWL